MYKLPPKIESLTPYEPLKGDFDIRLDANESFISLPKEILEKIISAQSAIQFNRYPDPYAENACSAFASFFGINKALVTAGNGSDELIQIIISGFFSKGDRVLITAPDFSMYKFYCHISELECVVAQKKNLNISAEEIIFAAKKYSANGVILSNPCNPTSCAIEKEGILKIIESLPQTLVVIDEAYMDFMGESVLDKIDKYDNLIVLKTCSKNFGLAAIRLGFAAACEKITSAIRSIKSPYNVNSLTAAAGAAVLSCREYLLECTEKIKAQKVKLFNLLSEIGGDFTLTDSRTNFVFIKTQKAEDIYNKLLAKKIAVRQIGGYLRVTAGSDSENSAFINAFKECL